VTKRRLAVIIALNVSRGSMPPDQATESARPRQDIDKTLDSMRDESAD